MANFFSVLIGITRNSYWGLELGIKVSRHASGLSVEGDLEYADELTLGRAFEGRRSYGN